MDTQVLTDVLRYIPATKQWRLWQGGRWAATDRLEHELLVREKLAVMCLEWEQRAAAAPTAAQAKPYLSMAQKYQSARGVQDVLHLIRAHVACTPDDFDIDPWTLNTPAGVVDLRTGAIRAAVPGDMLARTTAVAPGFGLAPLWSRFIDDTTGGAELRTYVQRMLGYALTGINTEKGFWHAWGGADTGKSTFVRTITEIMGDYADTVDADALLSSKGDRIPAELARMPGVRLVTATEPPAGVAWNEKRLKAITGGDKIEVRFLHANPFTYSPQFKLLIVGNHAPEIRHVDDAMLRRVHILPLDRAVPRERQIADLSERMVAEEGPAILAWMIEGCMEWQRSGLQAPSVVLASTREYAETEDTLAQWADEECEADRDAATSVHELYVAWNTWCRSRGEQPGGEKSFRRRLRPLAPRYRGLTETRVGSRRGVRGIRLRPVNEEGVL